MGLSRAELRGAVAVLGSVVLFGILVHPAGLPIAIAVSALTCQLGSPTFRLVRATAISVAIAAAATLVFVEGLGVRAPLWPLFG
jgi:NADH:ubiquinone oxidoreductase subunit 4 (subunit M)